ncbi:MAG: ABC transporter transmembrane domain-containing protein [Chthoniobacterales bacterium]
MADPKKKKIPFPQLVRQLWGPYFTLATYLRPYRARFIMGLGFGMAFGVISGLLPLIAKYVLDNVAPGMSQQEVLSSGGVEQGPKIDEFLWIVALIPVVMITRSVLSYLNSYCMAWVSLRILRDMRAKLFAHLMSQSLDFFNRAKSGKLISRVLNDTRMAQNALVSIAGDIFKDPIAVITGVCVLVWMDWKFSLTTLFLFPICIVPVAVYGRKVRKAGKAEENEAGQMAVILQESFAGIRIIKSFAREDYQSGQFDLSSDLQCRTSMKVRKSIEIVQPMIEAVSALGVVLALFYVYFGGLGATKFVALMAGIFLLYEPVKRLSRIPMLMQKCLASATNIFDLMEQTASVQDAENAIVIERARGEIEFDNVGFSYGGAPGKAAVEEFSLKIPEGKRYALVGASGAGKSTLLNLLLRFYDPQSGVVRLDGYDLKDIKQTSLRENIGIVTQESFLFHDTIFENIRYGRLDATRAEIEAAAKLAYAHEFIMEQPEGYDTVVGDKGSLLSGGQQQRLAIARALLKNAPILLLDEATSALDSESERMIQAALERLAQGRTVIAIAHRLSTILKSDQIVVMDQGRIAEIGTHSQLLEESGLYRKLYEIQFHHHDEVTLAA